MENDQRYQVPGTSVPTLTPEEKKKKAKKRIFVLMVVTDIALALLVLFEIIDLFV